MYVCAWAIKIFVLAFLAANTNEQILDYQIPAIKHIWIGTEQWDDCINYVVKKVGLKNEVFRIPLVFLKQFWNFKKMLFNALIAILKNFH